MEAVGKVYSNKTKSIFILVTLHTENIKKINTLLNLKEHFPFKEQSQAPVLKINKSNYVLKRPC